MNRNIALSGIYAIDSKFFHLNKILFRNLAKIETFYKTYVSGSDINMCRRRNGRNNLFRKSSVVKEYEGENPIEVETNYL